MTDKLRIVFMGTPDFAVESLKALHEGGYNIVGVITSTDKWGGRGRKQLLESAVKKYAKDHDLPLLQPRNLKDQDFLKELKAWKADLQVVVAFRMLPEMVWDMPPEGTVNLHASLLPAYRGAAPINWAIINGEKETGVTTFRLKHEIDTGDIISRKKVEITPEDTAGSLHDKLMKAGAALLLESVRSIADGTVQYHPQPMEGNYPAAPKIYFEGCKINFNKPVKRVYNFIRGLDPYPSAWTVIDGKVVKCFDAKISENANQGTPAVIEGDQEMLKINCSPGQIEIHTVKVEGKRKMSAKAWLNGYSIQKNKAD